MILMAAQSEEEMQQKAIIYQLLQQRLEELRSQGTMIETTYAQTDSTYTGISTMAGLKNGEEILVNLGSGIFSKALSTNVETVLVNVGSGILIEKTIDEAKKFLEERKEELENAGERLSQEVGNVAMTMNQIVEELQK